MSISKINVGQDFSRYPVGRYRTDGESNGEAFREDLLRPALVKGAVQVFMDDAFGYGSSFLEEVFGGLIRTGYTLATLGPILTIESSDDSLLEEINGYMRDAEALKRKD